MLKGSAKSDLLVRAVPASKGAPSTIAVWARQLRVHQYAKNALVLVPLLTAHRFDLDSIRHAIVAAVAFSFCASAVYIINDLADLDADRTHLTKRSRPLASGAIRPIDGILAREDWHPPARLAGGQAVHCGVSRGRHGPHRRERSGTADRAPERNDPDR